MDNSQLKQETQKLRASCYPAARNWATFFQRKPPPLPVVKPEIDPSKKNYYCLLTRESISVFKEKISDEIVITEKKQTPNSLLSPLQPQGRLSLYHLQIDQDDTKRLVISEETHVYATFSNMKEALYYCIDKGRADWFEQLLMAGVKVGISDDEIDALRQKHFPQKIDEESNEKEPIANPLLPNKGLTFKI